MQVAAVEAQIDSLDARAEPSALRFDAGPPLTGRVAVLPSAFNPPTFGHLRLLEIAATVEGVSGAAALLSTRNVDKDLHGAGLADRIGMLLAARGTREFAVLAANAARIADQARALQRAFSGVAFDFVAGYDTLVRVFDPRYYDDMTADLDAFFTDHRLIATNRGAATTRTVRAYIESAAGRYADGIVVRTIEPHEGSLSSTAARAAVAAGGSASEVPDDVAAYIAARGLYAES